MSGDKAWYLVALGVLALGLNPAGKLDNFCLSNLEGRAQAALLRAEMKAGRSMAIARFALTGEQPVRRVLVPQIDVERVRAEAQQARIMALAQVQECAAKRQMMVDAARMKADMAQQILIERRGQHPMVFVAPMIMPEDVTEPEKGDDGTI